MHSDRRRTTDASVETSSVRFSLYPKLGVFNVDIVEPADYGITYFCS